MKAVFLLSGLFLLQEEIFLIQLHRPHWVLCKFFGVSIKNLLKESIFLQLTGKLCVENNKSNPFPINGSFFFFLTIYLFIYNCKVDIIFQLHESTWAILWLIRFWIHYTETKSQRNFAGFKEENFFYWFFILYHFLFKGSLVWFLIVKQEEDSLAEIVQLVGKDSLSEDQKVLSEKVTKRI